MPPTAYYFPPVPESQQTTHDLNTLADFADTLDALPLELTRGFSDLRELDAVLSSSLIHLTESIKNLTTAVNDPAKTPGERLILLKEVAEFAQRFKLGGEDKIRVVGGVCEGVISHQTHLLSLLSHSSLLQPRAAPLPEGSSYLPPTLPGKRTRARAGAEIGGGAGGGAGASGSGAGGGGGAPTPVKKRKVGPAGGARGGGNNNNDDDDERAGGRFAGTSGRAGLEGGRSPKLPAAVLKKGGGGGGKKKATDSARPASPFPAAPSPRPSSRLPVTSTSTSTNEMDHLNLVDSVTAGGLGYGAGIDDLDTTAATSSRSGPAKKRRAGGATSATASASGAGGAGDDESSSEEGAGRPRRRKVHAVRPRAGYVSESSTTPPPTTAAAYAGGAAGGGPASGGTAEGKVDIEDGVAYCYCAGPSYGEMIGCDSEECEREWFHLECLQLSSPPEGTWYCPTCQKEKDDEAAAKKAKGGRAAPGGGAGKRRA